MNIIGFDFDGVFIDIESEKADLFADIVKNNWGINSNVARKVWKKYLGTSRRYKFDCLYKRYIKSDLADDQYNLIEQEFSDILLKEYYPNAELICESVEVAINFGIDCLSFISSGISYDEIQFLTNYFHLNTYFDVIFGTNHLYKSKEDHFREIIRNNQVENTVYIGDGLEDMRVAKKFGFTAIGIPANHTPKELIKSGANIISSHKDLYENVQHLMNAW